MNEIELYVKQLNDELEMRNNERKSSGAIFKVFSECKQYKLKDLQKYQEKYNLIIEKTLHSPITKDDDYYIRHQGGIVIYRPDCDLLKHIK